LTEICEAVGEVLVLTCRGLLLHKGVCQGGLAGSEEMGEAYGFHLDCAAAGVPHAADQLWDAAGVALHHCIKSLRPVSYKGNNASQRWQTYKTDYKHKHKHKNKVYMRKKGKPKILNSWISSATKGITYDDDE